MGMPAINVRRWRAADIRELPDTPGKRFECVDGELLVSPSPRLAHQSAVLFLASRLYEYCRAQASGAVFTAPGDVELDPLTLVQPDVFVLPLVEGRRPVNNEDVHQALLFIEVLSPSTARFDRVVKRARYQRYGVEYWIVDLDARLVERWDVGADRPLIVTEAVTWQPPGAREPIVISVHELFVEALGLR